MMMGSGGRRQATAAGIMKNQGSLIIITPVFEVQVSSFSVK
jgi:hypothetical protein